MRLSATSILFALGVNLLALIALAQPCEAKIVYTPTNQVLTNDGTLAIDFNHDGIADFTIDQTFDPGYCFYANAVVQPASGNAVLSAVTELDGPWAAALSLGAFVGNSQPFTTSRAILTDLYGRPGCPFTHGGGYYGSGYLGVEFFKNGKAHFGWAQLSITLSLSRFLSKMTTTLSGYAYQTNAGQAIPAGKT
jgi:hypothetical protein